MTKDVLTDREKEWLRDKQIHRLALEVVRMLNGMSVGMARSVLSCADNLVQFGAELDVDRPMFQGEVGTYNERFRDSVSIRSGKSSSQRVVQVWEPPNRG